MSDRPWLEASDPSLQLERELLKRLNEAEPPAGSAEQGWNTLASAISGLPALDPAASGGAEPLHVATQAASGAAGLGLAAKLALGVAVSGGVLWMGAQLLTSSSESSRSTDTQPALQRQGASGLSVPAEAPLASTGPSTVGSAESGLGEPVPGLKSPVAAARPASSVTTLAEEGRLLAKAHQLVQAGQGREALELLRLSQSRYPRSGLAQEREVLSIEALNTTGAADAARLRAQRFLKRHPSSPHAGRLERFVK